LLQGSNGNNIFSCWINFDNLIKNSAKVIAMDADTGFHTYDLLASSHKHVRMINNLWCPSPEEAPIDMYYDQQEAFMATIAAATTKAKTEPFVVVSTSRTQAEVIHKHCLATCPDAVIKKYNLDSSAVDRKDFDDVNKVWANVDILIYTSTISTSCSFKLPRFTRIFGYFSSLSTDYKMVIQMTGHVRNILTREYHIYINSRANDLPIHKEVERSIIDKFRALSGCSDPLVSRLFSVNAQLDFIHKDLFHKTHVNNLVHINRSRSFYSMLFKRSHRQMGIVIRKPTPIVVPVGLKRIIAKDRKEVAAIDDAQEATALNIDHDQYMELSSKPFLELEEKMEVKKYNLATHYGVDQTKITPEFVKTFDREKPRTVWYNTVKALDTKMKLHDAIVDWCSKSAGEIEDRIDLKRRSPNIIMCLLVMDGLNEVMPQTKGVKFTESVPHFASAKTKRQVVEAGLDRFIAVIRHYKEMVSQMFNIKISVITSNKQTFRSKLNLVNAIFKKTFGLALKGKHVRTGGTNDFTLQLMDCFTYVDGAMALKLPSGKLIKSLLNKSKQQVPEVLQVPEEVQPDIKPINLCSHNIAHPDNSLSLARWS